MFRGFQPLHQGKFVHSVDEMCTTSNNYVYIFKSGGVIYIYIYIYIYDIKSRYDIKSQVVLAPNFKAHVSRPLYSDPAFPGCRLVDLTEIRGGKHVF